MNRKLLVFAALGLALVVLPLVAKLTRGDAAKLVEIAEVAPQQIRSAVLASGQLAYREQVQLRSEVIGRAATVPVEQGDRVAAGDLILSLDPEQFRTQVEQQQANVRLQEIAISRQRVLLENLERRVERTRELFRRGLADTNSQEAAENELALAKMDLRSRQESLSQAQAALAQARDALAKTEIRSPIDGIVIQLDVKPGESVIAGTTNIPGSTVAVIADTSSMLTDLRVDEADIARVAVGQSASIFAAGFPDTALPGVVESIATTARRAEGQQNLSFEVRVRLTEPELAAVRPGMSCRAEVYTETSEDALAVPVAAVLYDEDEKAGSEQAYVFVVADGKAQKRTVETGLSSDSHMEITEGLNAGEQVVSGPFRTLRSLREGDRVKAEEKKAGDRAAKRDDG
jgi:HlyD family secretion protein